jgi:hypothetical protein
MSPHEHLTDGQIERLLRLRSADPYPGLVRDILTTTSRMEQKRRWRPAWPSPRTTGLLAATALLTALLIGGALVVGGALQPPPPSPAPTPDGWVGPVRPETVTMPTILPEGNAPDGFVWDDGQDAELEWIDIGKVRTSDLGRRRWSFELAGTPPKASTLDPKQRVISYGVVLDADGDRVADCLIGISNDAPQRGDFRVWVTNLATGATSEQVGGPYGFPIDFAHPDEQSEPSMQFFFLGSASPCVASQPTGPRHFYTWASVTDGGRVTAWDYAPDAAWLAVPNPGDPQ